MGQCEVLLPTSTLHISDSLGAALWGLDYAMQMAHSNFLAVLFHVGSQSVFYNPFTHTPFLSISFLVKFPLCPFESLLNSSLFLNSQTHQVEMVQKIESTNQTHGYSPTTKIKPSLHHLC